MGVGIPKQFIEVRGKPVIAYTLERFQMCSLVDAIEVVCVSSYVKKLGSIARKYGLTKVRFVVEGGETYQDSVINGIEALRDACGDDDIVSIHFAASPFVTEDIIVDSVSVAAKYGNGISSDPVVLCLAEKDTTDGGLSSIVGHDRERMMGLNSPQSFRFGLLKGLYAEGAAKGILDEIDPHTTSLMAALGCRIYFSKGSTANIKITTADDLRLFEGWVLTGSA